MYNHLDPALYFKSSYDFKERFISYWHQIDEITKLKPSSILEIGIGNSLVSSYLQARNFNITTMDIEHDLVPSVVGSIDNAPFVDGSFDLIACFELLEHLPYSLFSLLLREIHRLTTKYALLSLPDISPIYRVSFDMLALGVRKFLIPLPQIHSSKHVFDGVHHWEIGKTETPLKRVIDSIVSERFRIEKTYRLFEMPYHRFFVLRRVQ